MGWKRKAPALRPTALRALGSAAPKTQRRELGQPSVVRNQGSGKDGGLRFVVPTHSTMKLWNGWGTQLFGLVEILKTLGAPPADEDAHRALD
jgi:hypothetical protein